MNEQPQNPFSKPAPNRGEDDLLKCVVCNAFIKRIDGVMIDRYFTCTNYECVGAILRRTTVQPPP